MFWKKHLESHPLSVEADQIALTDRRRDRKALGSNLRHDPRVTDERARAFLRFGENWLARPGTRIPREDVLACLEHYYETRVRDRLKPDSDLPFNADNVSALRPDQWLCNILNVSRLFEPLDKGLMPSDRRNVVFKDFPEQNLGDYQKWIDDAMRGSTADPRVALEGIFEVLSRHNSVHPWQPTWVVPWNSFYPYRNDSADRWLQLMGMPPSPEAWLVCLRYQVGDVKKIFRPTQLDAGQSHWHFPSPPDRDHEPKLDGHTMDLRALPPPIDRLLPEFIHTQIAKEIRFWDDARHEMHGASSIKKTSDVRPLDPSQPEFGPLVDDLRRQHWKRLVIQFPVECGGWLAGPYI